MSSGNEVSAARKFTGTVLCNRMPLGNRSRKMNLHVANPYFDEWHAQLPQQRQREGTIQEVLVRRQIDQLAPLLNHRKPYQSRYSYAIPNREALSTISELAPLVEIGAGTGYWAWLLRQMGVDIVCYDASPPSSDSARNQFHPRSRCWTEVLQGDETKLDQHADRTLFLCWPPVRDPMGHRVLDRYKGDIFVGVFEPPLAV